MPYHGLEFSRADAEALFVSGHGMKTESHPYQGSHESEVGEVLAMVRAAAAKTQLEPRSTTCGRGTAATGRKRLLRRCLPCSAVGTQRPPFGPRGAHRLLR